ncbi:UBC-like protein [Testicularia cyperi]|uniref:UBC-like protein n=1 Tax=Testicularia cyperi TaxID=1882483 RepID=A0A317XYZ6_9BASI|nr:UBC-like protein [Testicularia cyperi]
MPTSQELQLEFAQRDISFQYSQLCIPSNCPPGVYVQLDDDDTHLWHAVLFVHTGPFKGGIFRFDIVFPPRYPSATPQVYFPPTLLHPLVDPNSGRLSLTTRFKSAWNPRRDFVTHILAFVRSVFETETLDTLLEGTVANQEVYRMYRSHRALFNKLAHQSVALSTSPSSLYDVSGGSGFPNPSVGIKSASDVGSTMAAGSSKARGNGNVANGILFHELTQEQLDSLRQDIFGDTAAQDPVLPGSPDLPSPSSDLLTST